MSLDGLRAWIGEVERKLRVRTRVVLVLVAIAIGGAGAGIYLALEADSEGVSADEIQVLEEQIGSLGSTTANSGLESKVAQLELEVERLRSEASDTGGSGAADEAEEAKPPGEKPETE